MNTSDIRKIAEKAEMIVCGYAFSRTEEGFVRVVGLHAPYHALVMTKDGEVIETTMDDIEIAVVLRHWNHNKEILEEAYAQVL